MSTIYVSPKLHQRLKKIRDDEGLRSYEIIIKRLLDEKYGEEKPAKGPETQTAKRMATATH